VKTESQSLAKSALRTTGLDHREVFRRYGESVLNQTVSHYRIIEKLGGGGMGVAYRAEDLALKREVALKFLPEDLTRDPAPVEPFQREAEAAAAINHPQYLHGS